jgi:hypothetical protein
MADWFSQIASQALTFADSIADSLVAQATEAQNQLIAEQQRLRAEENSRKVHIDSSYLLPWETENENLAILSQDLMEQILGLSLNEENFTSTAQNSASVHFYFKQFIPVAMNMIGLDSNLARLHSKLSPKMDEEIFWFNYYCRISYLRAIIGMEGEEAKENALRFERNRIIASNSETANAVMSQGAGLFDQEFRAASATARGADPPCKAPPAHKDTTAILASNHTQNEVDDNSLEKEVEAALEKYLDAGEEDANGDDVDVDVDLDDLEFLDELESNDDNDEGHATGAEIPGDNSGGSYVNIDSAADDHSGVV